MKKIYNMLFLLAAVMIYSSCTSDVDDVFDKSSSERVEEAITADNAILTSASNGWLMEYYADTKYGGYNVLCKFNADNTVTVANEVFGADTTATTHYKFDQSQGVILSFDEYNGLFHYFSDPANPDKIGTNGEGMKGDFEFRVQKATSDSIILLGKKNESKIIMTRMPEGTAWADYINKVEAVAGSMSYNNYGVVVGTDTIAASASYHTLAFTDPKTGNDITMPYIQTTTGYKLYEPVTYAGKTITGFTYSDNDQWVNPADNTVKLVPIIPPLTEQLVNNYWFIAYSQLGTFAQKYWDTVKAGADALSETLYYAMFGTYSSNDLGTHFGLTFCSGGYWGQYIFNSTVVADDEITLSYTNTTSGYGGWYANYGNYHYGCVPFGTSKTPRTFKLTTDNLKAPSYITLTDEGNPDNVITLYAKEVLNVFAN